MLYPLANIANTLEFLDLFEGIELYLTNGATYRLSMAK